MDIDNGYEKYIGFIEKNIRLKKGLSLDNVSHDLKISKGNLSDSENGKKLMRETIFKRFLDYYGIEFCFDRCLLDEIRRLLGNLMDAYIYKNRVKEAQVLEQFIQRQSVYEYSFGCLYVPLFIMMSSRAKEPSSLSKIETRAYDEIDEYTPVFNNDETALILYLKAFQAGKRRAFDQSVKYYAMALDSFNGRLWPQLEGIIKLNYAKSLTIASSYYDGYLSAKEAHDLFVKHGNYVRALTCFNNLANYLLCLQSFSAAKTCSEKVLLSMASFTEDSLYRHAVTTMLIILTLEGSFEEAIQFAKDHPVDWSDGFVGNLILIPYCYYRLGQKECCLKEMEKFDPDLLESDDKALFALLKAILRENSAKIEAAKQKMLRICCRQKNWLMLMVLYQLLIDYYKSVNDLELLADAYEGNSKVLRHQLPLSI